MIVIGAGRRRPRPWVVIHVLIEAVFAAACITQFALWLADGQHKHLFNAGIWLFWSVAPALLVLDGWWGRTRSGRPRLEEKVDAVEEKVDIVTGAVMEVRDRLAGPGRRGGLTLIRGGERSH